MTWAPPARPDWVVAANRGDVALLADEAGRPLDRDGLLAEARARLGLGADAGVGAIDGDDGFLEPLDVALAALEGEARLTVVGRVLTRRYLLRLLEVRYQLAAYVATDPAVREEEVAAPVVVTGAPRTGTTLLYGLMALDPRLRAPQGWELLRPLPPPPAEAPVDEARVTLADAELRAMATVTSGLDAIHVYSGRMPKECLSAMSFTFLTEELTARYHVPSYAAYLASADMAPAYAMHRLVLQVLQRRRPGTRWLLKSPVHLHAMGDLVATYPDVHLVVTHRDPLAVLPSVTSLVATLRWAHSDHVDLPDIGRYHLDLYAGALDHLVDLDDDDQLCGRPTVHVRHLDVERDTPAEVRRTYAELGLDLPEEVERSIVARLEREPRGAHGEHRYDLADLDLDVPAAAARFTRYGEHFGVPVGRPA